MIWKLADAKNRFSELFNLALQDGPQSVTRRSDIVVVMSKQDYDRLSGKIPPFKEFLLGGPSFEGVDISRDKSPMREIKF